MTYTQETIDTIALKTVGDIYSSLFFEDGTRSVAESQRANNLIMYISPLFREMNTACGTRARKSIASLCAVLSSRGIVWMKSSNECLNVKIGECDIFVAYNKGIEVALDSTKSGHDRQFMHCTASESDIADFIELIAAADASSRLLVEKRYQEAGRNRMISEVEYPGLEKEVADFLVPRGINYTLDNNRGENILSIQIIKEIWMRKAVSSEEIEMDLRLVPYLIKRPDCIKRDGRGFAIFYDWNWDKRRK